MLEPAYLFQVPKTKRVACINYMFKTSEKISELENDIKSLEEAFDLLSDHVIITDADANIIYANEAVRGQTGYNPSEVIGKNPGKLWGGNMPKSFYEDMWKTIKVDKWPFVGEVKNKGKDGEEYWQELRIFPVLDGDGEILIFIGIEPNITARKNAEAKLKSKFGEIDKLNKFMLGRELKMAELKKEVELLKNRLTDITNSRNQWA